MNSKNNGGFMSKSIKCFHCGETFRIIDNEKNAEYCPYCSNCLYDNNTLSNDELIEQIKKAENE